MNWSDAIGIPVVLLGAVILLYPMVITFDIGPHCVLSFEGPPAESPSFLFGLDAFSFSCLGGIVMAFGVGIVSFDLRSSKCGFSLPDSIEFPAKDN